MQTNARPPLRSASKPRGGESPMTWYGENLFRVSLPEGAAGVEVCATDAAGNEACVPA